MEHKPGYIGKDRADALYHVLSALVPWKRFAPSPKSRQVYRWSPDVSSGLPDLDGILTGLVDTLQIDRQVMVQGVFLNYYQNGKDYCPYHRDTYGTDVYTLSLGDTRDFMLKKDGPGRATSYTLRSGDLYLMKKDLHRDHRHSIPVRKGRKNGRISVVFFAIPILPSIPAGLMGLGNG